MAKGHDIQERLIDFAVKIIKFCDDLPNTKAGTHVAGQLLRSGTSPAPNYAEARGAESVKDFIHKLGVALKEISESNIWLKIILRSKMLPPTRIDPMINECDELGRIIYSSIKTAKSRKKSVTTND